MVNKMPTIFVDLPYNKGSFEIELRDDRQKFIVEEFLRIVKEYSLDIDKKDLENIVRISRA